MSFLDDDDTRFKRLLKTGTAQEVASKLYDERRTILHPGVGLLSVLDYLDIARWGTEDEADISRERSIERLLPLAQTLIDQEKEHDTTKDSSSSE